MPDQNQTKNLPTAKEAFRFTSRLNLTEMTGRQARDLAELLETVKTVPGSVIYHHTHRFVQQHLFLSPEPPNDFAYWVTNVLQEDALGEQLAAIDIIQYSSIREIQSKLIQTIENYLTKHPDSLRTAPAGEEFNFMKSVTFVIPTQYTAHNLADFCDMLAKVSVHSFYFHMFEARLRLGRPTNDFSIWFDEALGEKDLARALSSIDPYTYTLDGLRKYICGLVQKRLKDYSYAYT